ncbi:uncharacterized protein B0P05DRAFT_542967 [Gilbertella persicaria]|uniref:uncharacterized protein n=1 Tax=Gilbertella persicaria TaxID=101096 RepID=UPI00221EB889|nr:uncharacterized protein B0P05DRAFT_542967 [Gilbertella persicaria]KAI8078218.1 hypothetical protein B0P05DRAFT_542967 [Gilbertella persicaria]
MSADSIIHIEEKETTEAAQRGERIIEKYLFFFGFIFPIAWFAGSSSWGTKTPSAFLWKKRCRIAATLSLTILIVLSAIIMVVNPGLVGLKTEYYATGAQTSSASNSAIRPGVPLIGGNGFGDAVAGTSVDNYD